MNANRMIQTIFAGGDADPRDAQARPNSDSVILKHRTAPLWGQLREAAQGARPQAARFSAVK